MVVRLVALAGGVASSVLFSQFPEFSQQYIQRLGGAVDELATVVADFDASAAEAGLSRQAALDELSGSTFLWKRQSDMSRTIARHDELLGDLRVLSASGDFRRVKYIFRFTDGELLSNTWANFRPAVPLTLAGFGCALIGFFVGAVASVFAASVLLGLVQALLR